METITSEDLHDKAEKVQLLDSEIRAIKQSIYELRETLDMIEWCIDKNRYSAISYVPDILPQANKIVEHFS